MELVSESRERCSFDCGILFFGLVLVWGIGAGVVCIFLGILIIVLLVIIWRLSVYIGTFEYCPIRCDSSR